MLKSHIRPYHSSITPLSLLYHSFPSGARETCIILFTLFSLSLHAQTDSTRYSHILRGEVSAGYAIPHNKYAAEILTAGKLTRAVNLSLGWKARGDSVSLSDEMYGRPVMSAGLLVMDYSKSPLHSFDNPPFPNSRPSTIGQVFTPYASVERTVLKTRRIEAGLNFIQGIGICTRPYDKQTNPENYFIGGRLSILAAFGAYCDVRIDDNWSVGATAELHHYSNGRLDFPNYGINSFEVGLNAKYNMNPDNKRRDIYAWRKMKNEVDDSFRRHLYTDISVSWMPRNLLCEYLYTWNNLPKDDPRYRTGRFSYHHSFAFDAALMYRYGRKLASGLGVEYIYAPLGDDVQYWENLNGYPTTYQKPHGFSIIAHHEAFYKHIGVHLSVGCYLKREPQQRNDQISPIFETIGLRYYLPVDNRRLFIGYNIRARATTADCFQFALGYKL